MILHVFCNPVWLQLLIAAYAHEIIRANTSKLRTGKVPMVSGTWLVVEDAGAVEVEPLVENILELEASPPAILFGCSGLFN